MTDITATPTDANPEIQELVAAVECLDRAKSEYDAAAMRARAALGRLPADVLARVDQVYGDTRGFDRSEFVARGAVKVIAAAA
jgi:hypothetical protein